MGKKVRYFPFGGLFIYKNPLVITFNISTIDSKAIKHFNLTFNDVVKNTTNQPNQCSPYQNINPLATD